MVLIIIRTAIIFIALLIIMRLMGKRQIGEMQPYELVITLVIADLACIPMADTSIPLLYGIVAILTIYLLHQIVCFADMLSTTLKKIISGKPSVVITKDGVDYTQLRKNSLDVADLIESMRALGYFSLDSVEYGVYEANGSFSALEKANADKGSSLPILIIAGGKYEKGNLKLLHLSRGFFDKILKENGIESARQVVVLTVDGSGRIYMQEKGKGYKVAACRLPEGLEW